MFGGQKTVKSVSEKAAELAKKQKRRKRLVQLQEDRDLELMRPTKKSVPVFYQ